MPQIFIFLLFYITSSMMVIGYGSFAKIIFLNKKNNYELGFLGLFGYLILYFISSTINFFSNLNIYLITIIYLIGVLFFIINLIFKKLDKKSLIIFFSILLLFSPLGIIAEPNEDFFFYYQPYINYITSSKIIFGVVNINNTLAFSTNSLYDIIVLFKINQFFENSLSIPILIFYILFLTYLIENLFKKINIFYFVVLFLSIVSFSKLRDFGTMLPPQLLMILIFCITYSLYTKQEEKSFLDKIIVLLVLAIILRFNSIIITPLIFLILITNYRYVFKFILKSKRLVFFTFLVLSFFVTKNIINSGCIVYPVSILCISDLNWSSNIKVTTQKYNKLKSDSKGWPFYAKEVFNIEDKFVWQNLEKENFYSYNIYSKTSPFFWGKYWLMDPNYKKIVNLFLLSLFVYLFLSISKNGKIEKEKINNVNFIYLLATITLISTLWFLLSPQMRYGGYFCFIIFFSLIISFLNEKFVKKNHIFNFILLIIVAISYMNIKNLNRISNDFLNKKFLNFPWPNTYILHQNIDFVEVKQNQTTFYKRLKTNKLVFDNGKNSILMCGDIKFPCIPEGKEICLGNKRNFYSHVLYIKNKEEEKCYNFMNENILY